MNFWLILAELLLVLLQIFAGFRHYSKDDGFLLLVLILDSLSPGVFGYGPLAKLELSRIGPFSFTVYFLLALSLLCQPSQQALTLGGKSATFSSFFSEKF